MHGLTTFATQLETAETQEVIGLNMRAPALHSAGSSDLSHPLPVSATLTP